MPFKITKNKDNTYKVVNKETGKIYAYKTKNYKKLISAIEIAKLKKKKK